MVGYSSGHSGRNSQRFVNAAKVVESEPACNSSPVVLPFLRERIREARKAARSHSDAEVLPFNDRSADALGIGLTENWDSLHGRDFSGGVSSRR